MTFPSDYKVVQIAGGNAAAVEAHVGAAREILVNTTDGSLHVLDGTTPGGTKVLTGTALTAALQSLDPVYLPTGTMELIEAAASGTQNQRGWTPWELRRTFAKLADTTTPSAWKILNAAMPEPLRTTSKNVNDLNDALEAGFYIADPSSAANLPGGVSTANNVNVGIIVIAQSLTNIIQVLFDRFDGGQSYTRTYIDSVWGAWVTHVSRADMTAAEDAITALESSVDTLETSDATSLKNTAQTFTVPEIQQVKANIALPKWELIQVIEWAGEVQADVINLSAFEFLRIHGWLQCSVADSLALRVSADNGATFYSSAGNYLLLGDGVANGSHSVFLVTTDASARLSVDSLRGGAYPGYVDFTLSGFNKVQTTPLIGRSIGVNATPQDYGYNVASRINPIVALDAIRLIAAAGNGITTGTTYVEGIRG